MFKQMKSVNLPRPVVRVAFTLMMAYPACLAGRWVGNALWAALVLSKA